MTFLFLSSDLDKKISESSFSTEYVEKMWKKLGM